MVDAADPGCESDSDTTESPNPSPPPQCADGLDNDGDGRVDFSGATAMAPDPDCSRASDTLEGPEPTTTTTTPPPPAPASGTVPPQCADGGDNDGDGKIDLADPGCTAAGDTTESPDPTTASAAADGDGDGEPDEADRCPQTPGTSSKGCPAQLRARTSLAFQGTGAGIRLSALSVTASSGAVVEVRCGRGCRRLRGTARGSRAVGFKRLRGRLLRFGTKLEVRVTMSNRIGDYVAYTISRRGVKKTNGCILPGASRVSSNCD